MASEALIDAAAAEYHASRKTSTNRRAKGAGPGTMIEQHTRLNSVFDGVAEVDRFSVAALCALAAEDFELAHETLGCLVSTLRTALRDWDSFRASLAKGGRDAA